MSNSRKEPPALRCLGEGPESSRPLAAGVVPTGSKRRQRGRWFASRGHGQPVGRIGGVLQTSGTSATGPSGRGHWTQVASGLDNWRPARCRLAGRSNKAAGGAPRAWAEWHEDKEGEVWFVREFVGVHASACSSRREQRDFRRSRAEPATQDTLKRELQRGALTLTSCHSGLGRRAIESSRGRFPVCRPVPMLALSRRGPRRAAPGSPKNRR